MMSGLIIEIKGESIAMSVGVTFIYKNGLTKMVLILYAVRGKYMTDWDNSQTGIHTPEGVIDWLRTNIASVVESTPLSVQMTQNDNTKIQILNIESTQTAGEITQIETQFPELVGKIVT